MCRPTFSCLHPIRPPRMGCSSETPVSRIPSKKSSKHATDDISRHYATDDISRHPDYSTELQTLLSTYYEELLGIAGASEVKAATQQCCVLRSSCLKAREPPEHPCRRIQQRQCGGSLGGSDSNCTGATQAGHTTTPGPSNVPVTRLSTPDGPTPAHRSERSA